MLQLMLLLGIAVAVIVTVVASLIAVRSSARCSTYASKLEHALHSMKLNDVRVTELGELCDALGKSMHKIRSREGMRATRAKEVDEQLTGQAWKDAQRKKLGLSVIQQTQSAKG